MKIWNIIKTTKYDYIYKLEYTYYEVEFYLLNSSYKRLAMLAKKHGRDDLFIKYWMLHKPEEHPKKIVKSLNHTRLGVTAQELRRFLKEYKS